MRKIFIVLAFVCLALVPVSAKGEIGVAVENEWFLSNGGDRVGTVDVWLDGANYFGSAGMFGLDYGLGFSKLIDVDGPSFVSSEKPFGGAVKFGFGYSIPVMDILDITGGVGVKMRILMNMDMDLYSENAHADVSAYIGAGIYADIAARIRPVEHLGLTIGLAFGIPAWGYLDMEVDSTTSPDSASPVTDIIYGVSVSPFVGISFVY